MIITSPTTSFIDFNGTPVNCTGEETELALPVFDNFGTKFQFSALDELVPNSTIFYVAVCNTECVTIYDPSYEAIHICNRYVLNIAGTPLADADFPLTVNAYSPAPYQPLIPAGVYSRSALLAILSDGYDFNIPGFDFITCCPDEIPTISGISVTRATGGGEVDLQMNSFFASAHVNFPTTAMTSYVSIGQCFRYCILNAAKQVIGCSNLFKRISNPCYTSVFNYYNEENSYGFKYVVLPDGSITENEIRLYIHFNKPTFEIVENIARQSNNVLKRVSTIVQRQFIGNVGYYSDDQHYKIVIMLKSDYLHVLYDNGNINRRMAQTGEYSPEYPDTNTYMSAPASFSITDFTRTVVNNNCGFSCGVEILDECTVVVSPGGNQSKYHIEFTIPTGAMAVGATTYTDTNLIGASDVEVYREGLIQYKTGDNYYSFVSATGVVTVYPAVTALERFSIWAV